MPTILASVIMIAGIFAFLPVEDVSTIHAIPGGLGGAVTARVVETLDESTGLSGDITISRAGEGVFTIDRLLICDKEFDNGVSASTWILFSTETDLLGDNFSVAGSAAVIGDYQDARNYSGSGVITARGHVVHSVISGSNFGSVAEQADNTCVDILRGAYNENSGGFDIKNLAGDENNDIILHFMRANGGQHDGDGDDAFLVAYISGASESAITITNDLNP